MALIGLKRASELTGKNQSTIHRAMKSGRLSYQTSDTGERLIDTSELDRVFPIQAPAGDTVPARNDAPSLQRNEAQVALRAQLEAERTKVALLQERGLGDVLVFGGGIIPDADVATLQAAGVAALFTPGTPLQRISDWLEQALDARAA